jgi:drug/metabolite transporter (DMT)-like permease
MTDTTAPPTIQILENPTLVMGLLLTFDSLHFVFGRWLVLNNLPPAVSAFFVLGIAALEIAMFMGVRGTIKWHVLRENFWFFVTIGILIAGATVLSYSSVQYIDAGTASLLARLGTVFTLGLGIVWLKDRLTRNEIIGSIIAIVGAMIISFQPGNYLRLGSLFVVGSSLMYALHIAVVKRYGEEMDFGNFFLFRVGCTAVFLLFYLVGSGTWTMPSTRAWFILVLVGTTDVVISRVLYYWALRRLKLSRHTILLTLSPVLAVVWSLLLFGDNPTLQGIIGGVVVIAGIYLTITKPKKII